MQLFGLFKVLGEAFGLAKILADPKNKDKNLKLYLTKKAIQDVKEAKQLSIHTDNFIGWLTNNMTAKTEKAKKDLKWYITVYKKLRNKFIL